jgi:hypothetical protein
MRRDETRLLPLANGKAPRRRVGRSLDGGAQPRQAQSLQTQPGRARPSCDLRR